MLRLITGLAITMISGPAFAGPTCTSESRDKWISETAMKAKISALGYRYKIFKVTTGNCYEIYGQDEHGQRIEIYFHPVTGDIIERHKS